MKILPPAWPNLELIQIWMILLFYLIVAFLKIWPQSRCSVYGAPALPGELQTQHFWSLLKEAAAVDDDDDDEKN